MYCPWRDWASFPTKCGLTSGLLFHTHYLITSFAVHSSPEKKVGQELFWLCGKNAEGCHTHTKKISANYGLICGAVCIPSFRPSAWSSGHHVGTQYTILSGFLHFKNQSFSEILTYLFPPKLLTTCFLLTVYHFSNSMLFWYDRQKPKMLTFLGCCRTEPQSTQPS